MSYIVLDLEWNQAPQGKAYEDSQMPFEIIEIGAVKLDGNFRAVGEYDRIIRPRLYTKLHYMVRDIIDISDEELRRGGNFQDVVVEFLEWCGSSPVFCTWGSGDLTELQRNMDYYGIENEFPMPFKYYDIQKMYSILHEDGKQRRSLQYVADEIGLDEKQEFHRAINDARYTAAIMGRIDIPAVREYYSIDCHRIPAGKSQEIHAVYPTYEKLVTRGYRTREGALDSGMKRPCVCYVCQRECEALVPWFINSKVCYGLFRCQEHGYVKARMRVRQADNGKFYMMRITKITDIKGAQRIIQKQENMEKKKKERRQEADE